MTTATGQIAINFAALSDANPYSNASYDYIGAGAGKVLSGVFRWASGASSRAALRYNGSVSASDEIRSKIEFGAAAGSGDSIAAIIVNANGDGYAAICNGATQIALQRIAALAQADALGSGTVSLAPGDVAELRLNQTTHALSVYVNGSAAGIGATDATVTSGLAPGFMSVADNMGNATITSFAADGIGATAPVLSSPTPSGTIGTQTTSFIGATTTQNTGTYYAVLSTTQSDVTTITEKTLIKTGKIASGANAPFAGSAAVSNTTPSIPITGQAGNTTYYFAAVQNNANGDSNIVTGSFTTASAYRSCKLRLRGTSGLLAGATLRFWTRYSHDGAAIDGGSTGIVLTSDANGEFYFNNNLTISAGAGLVTTKDDSDPYNSHNHPAVFI